MPPLAVIQATLIARPKARRAGLVVRVPYPRVARRSRIPRTSAELSRPFRKEQPRPPVQRPSRGTYWTGRSQRGEPMR